MPTPTSPVPSGLLPRPHPAPNWAAPLTGGRWNQTTFPDVTNSNTTAAPAKPTTLREATHTSGAGRFFHPASPYPSRLRCEA